MSMKLIALPRRTGKTLELVKKSAHDNIPIVVSCNRDVRQVKSIARSIDVKIPEPITAYEMHGYKHAGLRGYDNVLVDDVFLNDLMHKALNYYLNSNVIACTMSTDELSDSV